MDICGPCRFRGKYTKFTKYCLTCQETQCKTCAEIHGSSKATRNHIILDIADLRNASKTYEDLEKFQNCCDHPEKKLEFFCVDHDHFKCSRCLLNIHTLDCKTILDIETAGEQLAAKKYNEQLTQDLESIIDHCEGEEKEIQSLINESPKERQTLEKYMDDFKHKILEELKKCKKDILDEVDTHVKKQVGELSNQQTALQETRQTAIENKALLETIISNNSKADIFRCSLSIMRQLNMFKVNDEADITDLFTHSVELSPAFDTLIESMNIHPLIKCRTIISSKTTVSNVNVMTDKDSFLEKTKQVAVIRDGDNTHKYTCSSADADTEGSDTKSTNSSTDESSKGPPDMSGQSVPVGNQLTAQAKKTNIDSQTLHMSDNTVTTPDAYQPYISGIVTLTDGSFVLSDSRLQRLIRVNENFTFKDTADLSHSTGKMTVLNDKYVAVCLPTANRVAFVSVSSEFKWMRNFKTKYSPRAIHALNANRLLVSMFDATAKKWYLQILTTEGAVCQDIDKTRVLLDAKNISSLQLTPTSQRHYLQCCNASNMLYCFEASGKEVFKYHVTSPKCLYVDSAGKIFLLDSSGLLHILANNGTLLQTMNVRKGANGLTSSRKGDTVVITKECSAFITVYKLIC